MQQLQEKVWAHCAKAPLSNVRQVRKLNALTFATFRVPAQHSAAHTTPLLHLMLRKHNVYIGGRCEHSVAF
jgi:hypothetical protein